SVHLFPLCCTLQLRPPPPTRPSSDLAYELLDPPELLVLVDAVSRGGPPGTPYVMKPDLALSAGGGAHAHGMDLPQVFATVRALRSEEHTFELQSRENLVCRLVLEKKN